MIFAVLERRLIQLFIKWVQFFINNVIIIIMRHVEHRGGNLSPCRYVEMSTTRLLEEGSSIWQLNISTQPTSTSFQKSTKCRTLKVSYLRETARCRSSSFLDNIHYNFKTSQTSKAMLQSSKCTDAKQNLTRNNPALFFKITAINNLLIPNFVLSVTSKELCQESRLKELCARKPRDAAAVLFGLKFADCIQWVTRLRVAKLRIKPG